MHICAYFLFNLAYYQCKANALPGIRIAKQSKQVQQNKTRLYQLAILFLYLTMLVISLAILSTVKSKWS